MWSHSGIFGQHNRPRIRSLQSLLLQNTSHLLLVARAWVVEVSALDGEVAVGWARLAEAAVQHLYSCPSSVCDEQRSRLSRNSKAIRSCSLLSDA